MNNFINLCFCFFNRNLFPENLVQACFQQVQTIYVEAEPGIKKKDSHPDILNGTNITTAGMETTMATVTAAFNETNITATVAPVLKMRALQYKDGMNVLGNSLVMGYIGSVNTSLLVPNQVSSPSYEMPSGGRM